MFGMNDMAADILKKIIPAEVLAMITPEKIEEVKEQVNAFATSISERFAAIEAQNKATHELLQGLLEVMQDGFQQSLDATKGNGNDNDISGSGQQPKLSRSRKRGANRSGSGNGGSAD